MIVHGFEPTVDWRIRIHGRPEYSFISCPSFTPPINKDKKIIPESRFHESPLI